MNDIINNTKNLGDLFDKLKMDKNDDFKFS